MLVCSLRHIYMCPAFTKTPDGILAILGKNPNIIMELTVGQHPAYCSYAGQSHHASVFSWRLCITQPQWVENLFYSHSGFCLVNDTVKFFWHEHVKYLIKYHKIIPQILLTFCLVTLRFSWPFLPGNAWISDANAVACKSQVTLWIPHTCLTGVTAA